MNEKAYVFIGDLIETEEQLPLNLFEGYYLRKASSFQLKKIKDFIDKYIGLLTFSLNKYESRYEKSGKNGYSIIPENKSHWKYFIIEHNQHQTKQELQLILTLSSLDLTILFEAVYMGGVHSITGKPVPSIMVSQLRTINYFHDDQIRSHPYPKTRKITKKSLEELNHINSLLLHFDKVKFPFISKALVDFISIKDISERSSFKVLSYFSVLELLLTTYRPRSSNDSSLSSQLQKKISLLNNQFKDKIDIQAYFKGSDTNTLETIIEKLYQYRNDIAHGNSSDFEKDLKILKNQKQIILLFLHDLLKRILIFSLEQPQLILDLKAC